MAQLGVIMKAETYKWYMLCILLLTLVFTYVDRLTFAVVAQGIKADIHLTDTQIGVLNGLAFALFYALMGIPIARWADRGNRVMIVALSTGLLSVVMTLVGSARSFLQLIFLRVAAGVGEAGVMPTANSLIPYHFARSERARAMGIYMLAAPLAYLTGDMAVGWVNQFYGWRTTYLLVGPTGLLLATLAILTLRERRKSGVSVVVPHSLEQSSKPVENLRQVAVSLWDNTTFRHLGIAYAVLTFTNAGIAQWQPAFLIRSFHLKTGEVGTWLGVLQAVGGLLGSYFGGVWASQRAANSERFQMRVAAVLGSILAVLLAGTYLANNKYMSFTFRGLSIIVGNFATVPLLAVKQSIVPAHMRATSMALVFLLSYLIGGVLGPFAGGVLSDLLHPVAGEQSLRYALLLLTPGFLWASFHVWRASKTVVHDMRVAEELDAGEAAAERERTLGASAR